MNETYEPILVEPDAPHGSEKVKNLLIMSKFRRMQNLAQAMKPDLALKLPTVIFNWRGLERISNIVDVESIPVRQEL